MKMAACSHGRCGARILFLLVAVLGSAHAQNNWVNPGSGLWRTGINWSAGSPPGGTTALTLITNANTKTVTIDAATPAANLTVLKLTVSAPAGSTNTLRLIDLSAPNPFQLMNTFTINDGGALCVTNSTLVVNGNLGGSFNILGGTAILESGLIDVSTVTARVGRATSGSLLVKTGTVQANEIIVGEFTGSRGSLTVEGGSVVLSSLLSLGDGASSTGTVAVTGGHLSVTNDITKIGNLGTGQIVVSNAAVALGNVSVGRHDGATGTLILQTNGILSLSDDLSIGRFTGSTGLVLVAGGELSILTNTIWVGRDGSGQMTISSGAVEASALLVAANVTNTDSGTVATSGGTLTVSSNLAVGDVAFSAGQMSISGGRVTVTNESATALLSVQNGSVSVTGGTIVTDSLLLTNTSGLLALSGGRLESKGTAVANGAPFVVGDGTNSATLHLLGGTHSFANGLVISRNAMLSGCGAIIGTIVNNGTIATNCGAAPVPPSILVQPASQVVKQGDSVSFSVTVTGDQPLSYQWFFNETNNLSVANDTLSLTNVQPADAGNYTVTVSNAAGSTNSSPAVLRVLFAPTLTDVNWTGSTFTFSLQTGDGFTYTLEYKNALGDVNWTTLKASTGTGGVLTFRDDAPTAPRRFYRVRVE